MTRYLRLCTASAAIVVAAIAAKAEIPLDYYSSLHGKCGAELKTAIHQVIAKDGDIAMLRYNTGSNATWWGFYLTDRNPDDNTVIDRYSYSRFEFGARGESVSGMDIEHSFAKSWWGGADVNAYRDLFNLMPSESSINRSKNDNIMGVVKVVTTASGDNGCTKIGFPTDDTSDSKQKVWEPADQWKGDFARSYLYMATAYQDYTWVGEQAARILTTEPYPTLKPWAYELYMDWARTDPVSDLEVRRNATVKSLQGNRNPYIDFPNLIEYVWGDSINTPLNIYTTVKTDRASGVVVGEDEVTEVPLSCNFKSDGNGDCIVEHTLRPDAIGNVWTHSASTGWIAVASKNKGATSYTADARLVTPEIDLTHFHNANFTFEHSVNYATDFAPSDHLNIAVRLEDGSEYPLDGIRWPHGNGTTFYASHRAYLNDYAGHKVRIVFHYTSDETVGCRWAIRNLQVSANGFSAEPISTHITGDINADGAVTVADLTMLIDALLTDDCSPLTDINADSTLTVADVTALINILLN